MAHENRGRNFLAGAALAVAMGMPLIFSPAVQAEMQVVAVEGAGYNVNASMADNLKSYVGRKVYLTLDSGKGLVGSVKAVGAHLVHIEKIDGKEYFDALVRIEGISAIDARFREVKR